MKPPRICFTHRQLGEFLLCQSALQEILLYVASVWPPVDMELTRIHSSAEENIAAGAETVIHVVGPPYRAIDIRVTNLPGDPQIAADALGELVNHRYAYDPTRPSLQVAVTASHGTGPHVHLQVHPRTELRDG